MSIILHITQEILHGIAERHYKIIEAQKRQTEFEQREAARREIFNLVDVGIPLTKKQKVLYPDLCVAVARSLHKEEMVADIMTAERHREQRRKIAGIFRLIGNILYFLFMLAVIVAFVIAVFGLVYHLIVNP